MRGSRSHTGDPGGFTSNGGRAVAPPGGDLMVNVGQSVVLLVVLRHPRVQAQTEVDLARYSSSRSACMRPIKGNDIGDLLSSNEALPKRWSSPL